ncbi:hypothetical protein IW262DRAFT_1542193 [Armillaria fumosa]|nr:hypothetical protein IW262DRAFT_1542193 [Armillaria fumosa]
MRDRKVEDVLFRVPRFQFIENSETFRAMFTLPQAATGTVEGDSDDKPIQLQGERCVSSRNITRGIDINIKALNNVGDDEMTDIRNTTISKILERQLKIDATERISLGEKYDVSAMVTSGIVALVRQQGGVSEEQTAILGLEIALRIQRIRIKLLENGVLSSRSW